MSQQEQVTIGWDDDDIHFVLVSFSIVLAHNSLQLDIVVPLGHIILIPGQPVIHLLLKQQIPHLEPLFWLERGSNPRSTAI